MNQEIVGNTSVSERVLVLEAIQQITNLKARYAHACDAGYDADAIAELFVEDGVWDGGDRGCFVGREAIHKWFSRASELYSFAIHWMTNPSITVEGDHAFASWYLLMAATTAHPEMPVWSAARYDDELVRIDGQWLFKSMKLRHWFTTPFEEGWVKRRFLSP